jgi:hypothetical protein
MKPTEVDIPPVHHIDGAGFGDQFVEDLTS